MKDPIFDLDLKDRSDWKTRPLTGLCGFLSIRNVEGLSLPEDEALIGLTCFLPGIWAVV
jgi:hypothetical protein